MKTIAMTELVGSAIVLFFEDDLLYEYFVCIFKSQRVRKNYNEKSGRGKR